MPNIDELSIQFSSKGTSTAVKNIKDMGYAVRGLAESLKAIDTSKLGAFKSAMSELKKSTPTATQTNRMVAFSDAIKELSSAIGTANISSFSKDMTTLGGAVETFKRSSVNSIQNAVTAMQNLGTATQQTASTIANVTPKKSQAISFTDSKGSVSASKEIVASLDKVQIKAKGVTSILQKMGIITPTKQFKTLEESAEKVRQKYEQLRSTIQKGLNEGSITSGDSTYKKKMAELDALRNKYDELILKQRELAQAGDAFKVNPTWEKSISAFKSGFSSVTGIVKGGLVAAMKGVNNHVKSFTSRIREAGLALKKTVSGGNNATKMAKKFANELLRVSKMLKLMIVRKALRAVIAEVGNGFQSLAIHSDEFNNSMSSLINGSKKLGYSFSAMVSPLINALAPAIVYVINLLTKLANVIQQVFGALTGATTWNKAKDFTDSWRDSIEGAGKAAKDLKKTVLGFDELNQLQENKDSSGGGSDITDMFETMKIDPKWKEFADWLKDMWKMGDFTELGKKLGEGLRSILESIPWDKIRATSHKLGESLATLINGFVEVERLGYDIGYTIAQSVNTVFEFLNGFVHKLHWDSIGKFIGETFNGFFENIDWALIKDTVVTGMAGIAEAIQNFIDTFHWDNISNFIINAIDTIASGIKAFVEGIDWLDLGKKMGDQIKKSVEGIDWYDIGVAIGDIIKAAIDWVSGMLETLPSVDTLIDKATDLLHGLFDRVDFEKLGANLGKIMQYIFDFITGFWDKNGKEIKNKVKEFFKGLWDNIDKEDLGKVLGTVLLGATLVGIVNALGTVAKILLTEKLKALITGAASSAAPEAAAAGTSVAASVVGGIVAFFAGAEIGKKIGAYLKPDDKELYESYSGIMGTIKMLIDTVKAAYDLWIMKAEEVLENLKTVGLFIEAVFLTLATTIKKSIDEIIQKFTEFKTNVETKIGEVQTAISEKIAEIKEDISSFIKDVKKFFDKDSWTLDGVAEGLTETFKKAKEGIKDIWNSIAEKLNGEYEIAGKTIKIKLPTFANGGFPEDGLFMANHSELVGSFANGKTAVANNGQIIEGISAGVYNAFAKAASNNSGGSKYISNEIIVDGEVIARTVTKAQEKQNRRYSPAY